MIKSNDRAIFKSWSIINGNGNLVNSFAFCSLSIGPGANTRKVTLQTLNLSKFCMMRRIWVWQTGQSGDFIVITATVFWVVSSFRLMRLPLVSVIISGNLQKRIVKNNKPVSCIFNLFIIGIYKESLECVWVLLFLQSELEIQGMVNRGKRYRLIKRQTF